MGRFCGVLLRLQRFHLCRLQGCSMHARRARQGQGTRHPWAGEGRGGTKPEETARRGRFLRTKSNLLFRWHVGPKGGQLRKHGGQGAGGRSGRGRQLRTAQSCGAASGAPSRRLAWPAKASAEAWSPPPPPPALGSLSAAIPPGLVSAPGCPSEAPPPSAAPWPRHARSPVASGPANRRFGDGFRPTLLQSCVSRRS